MLEPLQPVPDAIVDAAGQVRFGIYDGPLRRIHLEDTRVTAFDLPLPMPMPKAAVRLRLKRWQHYALVLPDLFVGFAVVDAGYLRTGWCVVVDRATGERFEHRRQGPLLDLRVAHSLWDDHTHLRTPGYAVEARNHLSGGGHDLRLAIDAAPGLPAVAGSLRAHHDLEQIQPLVVVMPVGPNRAMYSHKVALPLEGSLTVGNREVPADPEEAFAILDVHEALYPHHTWWRWATFAGRHDDGRALAMNLTHNLIRDDERWNENALWLDGRLHRLGAARFHFKKDDHLAPWRLTTSDGAVDLTFTPQGERQENLDFGLVRSVFHQPYGTFAGILKIGGETLEVSDLFGVCEDHDARW